MQEFDAPEAILVLEDGSVFRGRSLGATGTTFGEIVFNTSMTGYQEILTDPSYCGQIVTMTYPEIGNYGFNTEDHESRNPFVAGFVVRNISPIPSNWRSQGTLHEFLLDKGIVGMFDIDTRALVRKIRSGGAMRSAISTEILDADQLLKKVLASPGMNGLDLARKVVPESACQWKETLSDWWEHSPHARADSAGPAAHVVALDFGMKQNISRHLVKCGFRVTIVPGNISAAEILALNPDGIFLSNGPGDPAATTWAIETIRQLLGKAPIFGICLGHQLLALACGAKTFKLKFGHRGANQPVIDLTTEKVEITSQNHGFAVSDDDLPADLEVTHRNLNDDTIAGLRHRTKDAISVQYHPEASAGPHDSHYLFHKFTDMVNRFAGSTAGV